MHAVAGSVACGRRFAAVQQEGFDLKMPELDVMAPPEPPRGAAEEAGRPKPKPTNKVRF